MPLAAITVAASVSLHRVVSFSTDLWRLETAHSSFCSSISAPTSKPDRGPSGAAQTPGTMIAAQLGNIPATLLRRLIPLLICC